MPETVRRFTVTVLTEARDAHRHLGVLPAFGFYGVAPVTPGPFRRPRVYDLSTADGVPYEKIARLHSAGVLTTTVLQTCVRYPEAERCRFRAVEEPLRAGATRD
jgi:hypothetical protein